MNCSKERADPLDVVAAALNCPRENVSMDSAMYRDHGWDSFGHVKVIVALESAYGIKIDDEAIERYATMRAIHQLYQEIQTQDRHGS